MSAGTQTTPKVRSNTMRRVISLVEVAGVGQENRKSQAHISSAANRSSTTIWRRGPWSRTTTEHGKPTTA